MAYKMSYLLIPGPPKSKENLTPNEGLADSLLVISIIGEPGASEPLSFLPVWVRPDGGHPPTAALLYLVATALLSRFEDTNSLAAPIFKEAVRVALASLRAPVMQRRGINDGGEAQG